MDRTYITEVNYPDIRGELYSNTRPTHPDQLFFRDLQKLRKGTELYIHTGGIGNRRRPVQFLKLKLSRVGGEITGQKRRWYMWLRELSGEEYPYDISVFGASPYNHPDRFKWYHANWIILKKD